MTVQRWWHRWQGICPDGVLVALTHGPSPGRPDEIDTRRAVVIPTIGCAARECETVMGYVGSWDHEPTDTELDAVTPPGYRSTDHKCRTRMDGGSCFYDLAPCRGVCEFPRIDAAPAR